MAYVRPVTGVTVVVSFVITNMACVTTLSATEDPASQMLLMLSAAMVWRLLPTMRTAPIVGVPAAATLVIGKTCTQPEKH